MMKKRTIWLILLSVSLFILLCGNVLFAGTKEKEKEGKEGYVIGVTVQDMSNEFMVMLVNALKKRQADLYPDVKLIINDAEGRSDKQANQVETFVTQGVDSIIICPRDGDALIPSCAAAVKAGVPVITMSANLNEDVGQVWSGSEHRSAGQIQMEYVAKALGGKGNVALLLGPIGHMAQIQRLEGYNDVLAKHPEMKVVFQLNGDWARDKGMTIMENWLQSGKKIDAVVAQNDEMALGALIAIESAGLGGQINVSGIDAIHYRKC
ncbi:MAG: hypothetical protein B5M53_11540 [Candidatus Cloacimonas sp. 4484_209]|nr:MAG: hypothetical protein B5M53_11540 [Candidatus Cloacimonas sp. 4484_209]